MIIWEATGSTKEFAPPLPGGEIFISDGPKCRLYKSEKWKLGYDEFNYSHKVTFLLFLKDQEK